MDRTKSQSADLSRNFLGDGSENCDVIRNHFATGDGTDPVASLKSLQEIFRDKLDADVVQLVFSECGCNVDEALETLFTLASEAKNQLFKNRPVGSQPAKQADFRLTNRKLSWNERSSSSTSADSSEMDSKVSSESVHVVDVVCHDNTRLAAGLSMADSVEPPSQSEELLSLIDSKQSKVLVILRGLPGSGKSTLAKNLQRGGVILSTDDFFCTQGTYRFDPYSLSEAHSWNRKRAECAMVDGKSPVIIDNTNTQQWEFRPYVLMGEKFKYVVQIVEPETPWKFRASELAKRNSHNVSKESIDRMLDRYEHNIKVENLLQTRPIIVEGEEVAAVTISTPAMQSNGPKTSAENGFEGKTETLEDRTLADLMVLVQNDSEESSSISRRTSASSSQDTSGWECDDEFTWAVDGRKGESSSSSSGSDLALHNKESVSKFVPKEFRRIAHHSDTLQPRSTKPFGKMKGFAKGQLETGAPLQDLKIETDWSMPDFPPHCSSNISTESPEIRTSHQIIEYTSSQTQTEVNDFVACHRVQNGLDSVDEYKVLRCKADLAGGDPVGTPLPHPTVRENPVFDKSTMTESHSDSVDSKVDCLVAMFPHIEVHDLKDILEKCHWDHGWAINILLDFGCEYNDPRKVVRIENILGGDSKKTNGAQGKETPSEEIQEEQPQAQMQSDSQPPKENRLQEKVPMSLILTLDPVFAMQLEELFGPVGFQVAPERLPAKDLQVKIDLGTARQIHQLWKQDVNDALRSELRNLISFRKEDDTAPLSAFTEAFPWSELPKEPRWQSYIQANEPLPLKMIMDMEQQIDNRRKELTKKLLPTGDDLSTKLKRQRLYEIFPGVDQTAMDEVFEANSCSFPETVLAIQQATGTYASPALAQDCEEQLLEKAKRESLQLNGVPRCENDFRTLTKRRQLISLFPGVDEATIDSLFRDNNYSFQETLLAIQKMHPSSDGTPAKNWEEQVLKFTQAASLQFDDNWQSWVGDNPNLEKIEEDEETVNCTQLRAEANAHHQQKVECFHKAQEAYRRGMKAVASFYSQQGELHKQKVQEANRRASETIVATRNVEPNCLDLHGLYTGEALDELRKFLAQKEIEFRTLSRNRIVLYIITGWGRHSISGQPKLRPAVVHYLERNGYRFETDHPGLVKIILT